MQNRSKTKQRIKKRAGKNNKETQNQKRSDQKYETKEKKTRNS